MMNKFLSSIFNTLAVRLFLIFWAVVLITVLLSGWISKQFADEERIKPVLPFEYKQLTKSARRLHFLNQYTTNLEQLIQTNKHSKHDYWLINLSNNQVNTNFSAKALNSEKLKSLIEQRMLHYSESYSRQSLISVSLKAYKFTGPLALTLNNNDYLLFIGRSVRPHGMVFFYWQLPQWAKILVPIVFSVFICWLLSWYITRPLRLLKTATLALAKGELSTRVKVVDQRKDELGSLAQTFNYMAEQLEISASAQKRLLADVSHELRTPLTRMQIALGIAQQSQTQQTEKNIPEKVAQCLQRFELEIGRLDKMIADVLQLSRIENGLSKVENYSFDLQALIEEITTDAQFIAQEKQLVINTDKVFEKVEQTQAVPFFGNENLIASALENIINNAIKYTAEQSVISVIAIKNTSAIILEICDQGEGVSAEALPHLFDPFYRANTDRDRATGGTGLGLAIAKRAAILHKGSIQAENITPHGLKVTITLPYTEDDKAK